jgi:hypothetical protein
MFSSFVSLGAACPTASSMSKYGLRSYSAPFDWLITSNFQWVLHYMMNDFSDFLQKNNLEIHDNNPRQFREKNSGFIFIHDKDYSFVDNYDELKKKYQNRIQIFLTRTKNPTCFLRSLNNEDELNYILENSQYINDVVKKGNLQNEIVFLVKKELEVQSLPFRYFKMHEAWDGQSRELLRGYFDKADDLLEFCAQNFDALTIMRNLAFDEQKERGVRTALRSRYNTLLKLLEADFNTISLAENIIIYGAGNIGKYFYKKIHKNCTVKYFIDKSKNEETIDDIPIVSLSEIKCFKNVSIIVTATHDFEKISANIRNYNDSIEIISLDNILQAL